MHSFRIIKSARGGKLMIYKDYIYNYTDIKARVERYRCQNRTCKGCVYVENEKISKEVDHDHSPVPHKIKKIQSMRKIKDLATNTTKSANKIIIDTIKNEENLDIIPKVTSIKDFIRKTRNKMINFQPKIFNDIPDNLKNDDDGNLFLRYDSGCDDNYRYLIFYSEFKSQIFFDKCDTILIDGTFKVAPYMFYQLIVLHGHFLGKSYPIIYVLMKNKTENQYVRILKQIKNMTKINPNLILTDFEKALNNALESVFEQSKLQLCFFHLSQSIWRRIQEYDLVKNYKQDIDFANIIKKIILSAFLPEDKIIHYYKKLKIELKKINNMNIEKLLKYLDYTYFGNSEIPYKAPIFDVKKWSVYERMLNNEPRTTNGAEAWHKSINSQISISNPNIAFFIKSILMEEDIKKIEIMQCLAGKINWSRKDYSKELKLFHLAKNLKFFEDNEYINNISKLYNFRFGE